ncbi:hypothetical protein ACFSLT_21955 [Novosphingobium resinovorum]
MLLQGAEGWDLSAVPLLGAMKPWQLVFFCAGLPGVLIALLLVFVKEPARRASTASAEVQTMSSAEIWATFRRWRGFYGNFYLGMPLFIIPLYAFPRGCRRC